MDVQEKVKPESKEGLLMKSSSYVNLPLEIYASDKDGNPVKDLIKNDSTGGAQNTMSDCSDWDLGYVNATYLGHTVSFYCEKSANDNVVVEYSFEITTPSSPKTTSTNNKGRIKVTPTAYPNFTPATTFTVNGLSSTYLSTYFDATLDADILKYRVVFSYNFTYSNWCTYQSYKPNITIELDCVNIGMFTSAYPSTPLKYTPDAYQVWVYNASPTTGTINFEGKSNHVALCYEQCHFPAYGWGSYHEVQYRLVGTNAWTTLTYIDQNDHSISVATGTYEYRSRGKITTSPSYFSEYSPINTVVVP